MFQKFKAFFIVALIIIAVLFGFSLMHSTVVALTWLMLKLGFVAIVAIIIYAVVKTRK